MKILVTGAKGFVGKNLIAQLKNLGYTDIYECDVDTTAEELDNYTNDCEFVFHLAGVNRPKEEKEFVEGNVGFTSVLLEKLKLHGNKCTIVISSSIQAALDNPYGKSKKAGEDLIFSYAKETGVKVFVYRFTNLFGKWCRPNYNSVVATFCYNIANDLPIQVTDEKKELELAYIDDVVKELIGVLNGSTNYIQNNFYYIPVSYKVTLGKLANLIKSFKDSRENLMLPNMKDEFCKKLYSTYLSYLPEDDYKYEVKVNSDSRGSFTELFKSEDRGQVSLNIAKPGIVKGNHWHHTKNEKFLVISGKAVIRFRKIDTDKVIEYYVSSDKLEIVDIPVGYTHNIENIGDTDLLTIMWANEVFDKENPDTYFLEV